MNERENKVLYRPVRYLSVQLRMSANVLIPCHVQYHGVDKLHV